MYLICPSLSVLRGVKYVRPKKKKKSVYMYFQLFCKIFDCTNQKYPDQMEEFM